MNSFEMLLGVAYLLQIGQEPHILGFKGNAVTKFIENTDKVVIFQTKNPRSEEKIRREQMYWRDTSRCCGWPGLLPLTNWAQ